MRIAFRLDANNRIGMGHAVRCSALAEALIELGCECAYFCRGNPEIHSFAESRGLSFETVPVMELSDELSFMRNALAGYNAVIIDSYFVSDTYIGALNRPGFTVVCCDDNALFEYSCDAVINGNLHAAELKFRFGHKKPKMLLGGGYALLRREFREAEPIEIRERAKRIFLCFGGSDLCNFTPKAIEALRILPDVEIETVLGAMTVCDGEVRSVAGKNVRIIKNPPSIADVMRGCDMAVVSGSSIVYELAALGIPSIIVTQADNQKLISEYLSKNGLMKYIGRQDTSDKGLLCYETEKLLRDANRRKREGMKLRETVSRRGPENAAAQLLKIMEVNKKNAHIG